jgi:hypothetical protein
MFWYMSFSGLTVEDAVIVDVSTRILLEKEWGESVQNSFQCDVIQ